MNIHTAGQFRILQHRLIKVYQENDIRYYYNINQLQAVYDRFKELVMQHQMLIKYSQDLNHVFTFITLGQVLIFSILICLVGYEIFIVSKKKVFIKYRIRTLNYRPFFQDNYLSEICMLDGLRLN